MDNIKTYLTEIILGVVVSGICSAIVIIYRKRKECSFLNTLKVMRRIKKIGIFGFHYNRKILQSDFDTTGAFISCAKSEIYYIGCWLSSSISGQDMSKRLYELAMRDVNIYICMISPSSPHLGAIADFFNETVDTLHSRLLQNLSTLIEIKHRLSLDKRENLSIFVHNSILTTSYWAIDPSIEGKEIFYLDHKTVHGLRYNSYGFVFKNTNEKEFSEALWQSYWSVLKNAQQIR